MTPKRHPWPIRLTLVAEADFRDIVSWTAEHFGRTQAHVYAKTLSTTLTELSDGPDLPGIKSRDEIGPGLYTVHVARNGRRGRHIVLFTICSEGERQIIEVLRILHDAMDLSRKLADVGMPSERL